MDNDKKIVYLKKMKRFLTNMLFSLFILFLSGCAVGQISDKKESDFYYKMGLSYLNEGNIQMAYVQLQKAYQINPDNKEILNSLGLVYLQLEDINNARNMFLKAVTIDPEYSDAYHNLGVTYMSKGLYKEAIDVFNKALANPVYLTPEKTFYLLGLSYYRLKQYEFAVNAYKDSIKRSPSFPLPYYGLALAFNKMGKLEDASNAINLAIEKDPLYKGNKSIFIDILKQKLLSAKGDEERDLRDFLDIIHY
jgi:Tfp pilus assembly protein PilF